MKAMYQLDIGAEHTHSDIEALLKRACISKRQSSSCFRFSESSANWPVSQREEVTANELARI